METSGQREMKRMMTNRKILQTAMEQSAINANCREELTVKPAEFVDKMNR